MLPSTDWISFAIIDDVTDAYIPLIQAIEEEVDTIDEAILGMHSGTDEKSHNHSSNSADMLRHVGDCRKKVMSLYRLMSNKADVIKGFAKRCNEQWSVAPKTEIGLYLGDIQDHIVTMTANLGHYEK
jgi:magnesium transporter